MRFGRAVVTVLLASSVNAQTTADVVIYGATPAGLAAARAAVREHVSVLVVEPTSQIGGMVTGGIGVTDTGTPQLVGGLSAEFFDSVAGMSPAAPTRPPQLMFRGVPIPFRVPRAWDIEPKNARLTFERWTKEDGYRLLRDNRVAEVTKRAGQIESVTLTGGGRVDGRVFIDASYEGDLMARAGVSHTYGRESTEKYGEKYAGVREPHFVRNYPDEVYRTPGIEYMHHGQFGADISARDAAGKLLWGIEPAGKERPGSADKRVQAYCFRLIATQRDDLRVPWPKPVRYDPRRYELLLRYIEKHPGITFARLVHLGPLPNGKWDLNASGPFSIDYVGGNYGYPGAAYSTRDRTYQDHVDYEKGFLWFLAHDSRLPAELRHEVNSWGLCRDEYPDSAHWPVQLYIREGRRMIGRYVMTERDILTDKTKADAIGMGNFVLDSHWVRRVADGRGFVRVEGHLDESISLTGKPYEIPFRSLTPVQKECTNLLVPVCLSASHVAICTIRMEPVYMMLGHAAGVAASMAAKSGKPVQEIEVAAMLATLAAQNGVLKNGDRRK